MVDTVFNGANILIGISFTIVGAMFWLFKQGQDEKFKAIEQRLEDLKSESKSDDHEVKEDLRRVDNVRVEQISTLHIRVDSTKDKLCDLAQRVSRIEK